MTSIYLGNQPVYDPLVLPNNSRINGVEHFYQETPPTTRGDGSALVDGDIWFQIGSEIWVRKGAYWVSQTTYTTEYPRLYTVFPSSISWSAMLPQTSFTRKSSSGGLVYIKDIFFNTNIPSASTSSFILDSSNYFISFWYVGSVNLPSDGVIDTLEKLLGENISTNQWSYVKQVNTVININPTGYSFVRILTNPVGSPNINPAGIGAFSIVQNLTYKMVYQ